MYLLTRFVQRRLHLPHRDTSLSAQRKDHGNESDDLNLINYLPV